MNKEKCENCGRIFGSKTSLWSTCDKADARTVCDDCDMDEHIQQAKDLLKKKWCGE